MHSLLVGKKSLVFCKNNGVMKIVNDRLFKILVSALPSGTVWLDVPSPSVDSGVANSIMVSLFCPCPLTLEL